MQSIDDILREMGGKACSAPPKVVESVNDDKSDIKTFQKWVSDETTAAVHFRQFDLEKKLGSRAGMSTSRVVKIRNILPPSVAEGAWAILKQCTDWQVSDARADTGNSDYGAGSTRHRFSATAGNFESQHKYLVLLYKALSNLLPGKEYAFQGAKYGSGDFIEPHDDAAYIDVVKIGSNSEPVLYSRSIAIVLYLCKGWTADDGGCFVDLQGGQIILPEFNSLVAFHVPRLHSVEAVQTQQRFRYSIFGWFLEEGQLYQLHSGSSKNSTKKKRNKHKKKRNPDSVDVVKKQKLENL